MTTSDPSTEVTSGVDSTAATKAQWVASGAPPVAARTSALNDPLLVARARIDAALENGGLAVLYVPSAAMQVATTDQKIKVLAQVLKMAETYSPNGDGGYDTHDLILAQLKTIIDTVKTPDEFDRVFHSINNEALLDNSLHSDKLQQQMTMNLARTKPGDWSEYSRYLDTVTGTTPTTGNTIDFLVDGPAVLQTIRPDLEKATKSIDISIFQWQPDDIGWELARGLADKANPSDPTKPKVAVRVLLDEKGTVSPDPKAAQKLIQFMRANNIEVIVNPSDLLSTHLDHRKVVIIDNETGYTGGMNVGANYQRHWHDQQSRIKGPLVSNLANEFRARWQQEGGSLRPGEASVAPFPQRGPDEARVVTHVGAHTDTYIKAAYLKAIYTAEKQITIANPYFADPDVVSALCNAAKRGVQVRVMLPEKNDEELLRDAARAYYPELIEAGVEVYEYTPRMAHNKCATIDGKWSTFGSSNLDARSLRYNDELNVVSLDPTVAKQIDEKMFEVDLAHSTRIKSYSIHARERLIKAASRFL